MLEKVWTFGKRPGQTTAKRGAGNSKPQSFGIILRAA
jgi:hypothetical protein